MKYVRRRAGKLYSNGNRTPRAKMLTKARKKARRMKIDRWL